MTCGWPEKNTLVVRSLLNLSKVAVDYLFGLRGVGINFRLRPMVDCSDLGKVVAKLVRSCIAMLVGLVK